MKRVRTTSIKLLPVVLALVLNAQGAHGQSASYARTIPCVTTAVGVTATRCLDEYGDINIGDEKARLDNFAIELQENPTATGYILCYAGRVTRARAAGSRN